MDLGNLYSREIRLIEQDTIDQIARYDDWYDAYFEDAAFLRAISPLTAEEHRDKCVEVERTYCANRIAKLRKAHSTASGQDHTWIGINPDPSHCTMESLAASMSELVTKYKMFSQYLYCVEQHTENGIRPHIHMLIHDTPKPHRVRDTLAKHFNTTTNFIQTQVFKNGKMYKEHVDYIQGLKRDTKQSYVEQDKNKRHIINILDYYTNLF